MFQPQVVKLCFDLIDESLVVSVCQVKVEQSKLEASYDFDLLGTTLRSRITGEWNGKAFDGRYQTTGGEGGEAVDEGVWNAARVK